MVEENPVQTSEQQAPPSKMEVQEPQIVKPPWGVSKKLLIGGIAPIFFLTFLLGFLFRGMLIAPEKTPAVPTPTPIAQEESTSPTPTERKSDLPQESIRFLPGKGYYDDSVSIITKTAPRIIVQASVSRIEQETNYTQFSKANIFDGTDWIQQIVTGTVYDTNVTQNTLIQNWMTNFPSNVGSESKTISIKLGTGKHQVSFSSTTIRDEINTQSKSNYTKFIYQGSGTLQIDNDQYDAYAIYSRTYSVNAADLAFFQKPEAIQTAWVAFWTEDGTFYHVDSLNTNNVARSIGSYALGLSFADNKKLKTNIVTTSKGAQNDVNAYAAEFGDPIKRSLQASFTQKLLKSPKNSYTWVFGPVDGNIIIDRRDTVQGIGLVEYIN